MQNSIVTTIGPIVTHIEHEIQRHVAKESILLILAGVLSGVPQAPQGKHPLRLGSVVVPGFVPEYEARVNAGAEVLPSWVNIMSKTNAGLGLALRLVVSFCC